jgi:quercetin dioxygenase-like cupin family protein
MLRRAQHQPVETDIKLTDDLFVKTAFVADAGTIIPQHSHRYDHVTLLAFGRMRVEAGGELLGDFTGPVGILIRAGVKHTMTTLSRGVVFACIHALHGTDGVEIAELHELELED